MRELGLDPLRRPHRALRDASLSAETSVTSDLLGTRVAPRPARRPRLHRPERYYVGRRPNDTEVYIVSRVELEPLAHLNYQSSAAFDWGCLSAGALELAFAMLAHTTESRPTDLVCETFRAEVLACLDPAGFVLSRGDIALWLMTLFSDGNGPSYEPGSDGDARLGRRAASWIRSWLRRA